MFEHMPFLFEVDGTRRMLLCKSDGEKKFKFGSFDDLRTTWRVHWRDAIGNDTRIETKCSEGAVECSPTCFHDGSKWTISFICQFHSGDDPKLLLHKVTTTDWITFSDPEYTESVVGYGYENNEWLASMHNSGREGIKREILLTSARGGCKLLVAKGMSILSLSYRSDDEDKIIVIGKRDDNKESESIVYSISSGEAKRILTDEGMPVYKCSILGDRLAHAVKVDGKFEHRVIRECQVSYGEPNGVIVEESK